MAFLKYTSFLLAFLIILIARTSATPLEDVCNQVSNRTFCLNDFLAKTNTPQPLPLLCQLAIIRVKGNAESVIETIHSLRKFPVDPVFKKFLFRCQALYMDSFNGLVGALDDLKNKQYGNIRVGATNAVKSASRCEALFTSPFISPLTYENRIFGYLGEILTVIATDLGNGKQV